MNRLGIVYPGLWGRGTGDLWFQVLSTDGREQQAEPYFRVNDFFFLSHGSYVTAVKVVFSGLSRCFSLPADAWTWVRIRWKSWQIAGMLRFPPAVIVQAVLSRCSMFYWFQISHWETFNFHFFVYIFVQQLLLEQFSVVYLDNLVKATLDQVSYVILSYQEEKVWLLVKIKTEALIKWNVRCVSNLSLRGNSW